jgi:hypothetical protein
MDKAVLLSALPCYMQTPHVVNTPPTLTDYS